LPNISDPIVRLLSAAMAKEDVNVEVIIKIFIAIDLM